MVARVTMNGCSRSTTTKKPLISPTATPDEQRGGRGPGRRAAPAAYRLLQTAPDRAMTTPMVRSKPPAMSTIVSAMASMASSLMRSITADRFP